MAKDIGSFPGRERERALEVSKLSDMGKYSKLFSKLSTFDYSQFLG